jgi:hypothetical protein
MLLSTRRQLSRRRECQQCRQCYQRRECHQRRQCRDYDIVDVIVDAMSTFYRHCRH